MPDLTLLVPLDGTEFSRRILPSVTRLFSPDRFRIKLLHVAQAPMVLPEPMAAPAMVGPDMTFYVYGTPLDDAARHPLYDEEELEAFRASLRDTLANEVALFEREGYEVETVVLLGDPVTQIAAIAGEGASGTEGADAVAMATHGRSGLSRFLLGSVALDVLERLTVPALLLRAKEEDE